MFCCVHLDSPLGGHNANQPHAKQDDTFSGRTCAGSHSTPALGVPDHQAACSLVLALRARSPLHLCSVRALARGPALAHGRALAECQAENTRQACPVVRESDPQTMRTHGHRFALGTLPEATTTWWRSHAVSLVLLKEPGTHLTA